MVSLAGEGSLWWNLLLSFVKFAVFLTPCFSLMLALVVLKGYDLPLLSFEVRSRVQIVL